MVMDMDTNTLRHGHYMHVCKHESFNDAATFSLENDPWPCYAYDMPLGPMRRGTTS